MKQAKPLNIGRIFIGGVSASIILYILMQYDVKLAWMYLAVLFLGILMVYQNVIFGQIKLITKILGV